MLDSGLALSTACDRYKIRLSLTYVKGHKSKLQSAKLRKSTLTNA